MAGFCNPAILKNSSNRIYFTTVVLLTLLRLEDAARAITIISTRNAITATAMRIQVFESIFCGPVVSVVVLELWDEEFSTAEPPPLLGAGAVLGVVVLGAGAVLGVELPEVPLSCARAVNEPSASISMALIIIQPNLLKWNRVDIKIFLISD